jgi:RNA polymerase sigma-70 factor (ECF subfamily)
MDTTTPMLRFRSRAADPDEFAARLAEHRGIVRKVAASYARDADDRADLTQEIALQLWRAWPGYEPGRPFATWMYRIALNVAISHRRREHARPAADALDERHDALVGDADIDAETRERLMLVHRAMQSLAPIDRALLLLHLDGVGHREAGDVLGLTETNVATRLSRIRQQLRRDTGA